jgi:ribosomal protein S6
MENEIEIKNYELAFHINPDMEETDIKRRAQEVYDLVTQSGGAILTSTEPKRIHLSYPIRHKNYAFFCVVSFTAGPETMEKINSQIKLHMEVLRYALISLPKTGKETRTLGVPRVRPIRPRTITDTTKIDKEATGQPVLKEREATSEKELDKEIEKAIEEL